MLHHIRRPFISNQYHFFFDDLYKGIYSVKDRGQGVGQTVTSIAELMKELIHIKIKVGYAKAGKLNNCIFRIILRLNTWGQFISFDTPAS